MNNTVKDVYQDLNKTNVVFWQFVYKIKVWISLKNSVILTKKSTVYDILNWLDTTLLYLTTTVRGFLHRSLFILHNTVHVRADSK